ncbi:MAG: D-glycero-beta-D-manno-heptose-7-phosphate kinase, partial [Thermodesulfobacteriota bacterium]
GRVKRISPEAPVPVVDVTSENLLLGGAANVAHNVSSLGGKVLMSGVVGRDSDGRRLVKELKNRGVVTEGIIVEEGRPTTIKTRIIAHSQQVVRFDREKRDGVGGETIAAVLDYLKGAVEAVDVVVISDYAKGLLTKELVKRVVRLGRQRGKMVVVDPKVNHFDYYRGATIITPNNDEASQASGIDIVDEASLLKAGRSLLTSSGCGAVLITRGEHGMSLFERGKRVCNIPTVAREVYDVSGAGDTVVAIMALALAAGASFREAAVIANYAAGIVVSKVGTATVSADELRRVINEAPL